MLALSPRRNAMSLFDEMDNFFNEPFFGSTAPFFSRTTAPQTMKTDIKEEDGLYLLSMDLPGYKKEDIKAELRDGYLTIKAEKNDDHEEKNENGYIVKERYSGSCVRSFYVGDEVKEEDIKAAYTDGILHLSFPSEKKQELAEPKYIAIA
jgi:HSP20 family protein